MTTCSRTSALRGHLIALRDSLDARLSRPSPEAGPPGGNVTGADGTRAGIVVPSQRTCGLGVARRIAHVTYRSEPELAVRFGHDHQDGEHPWEGGRYAVESYLDHHADKLVWRFDAGSYVTLAEAMNSHDIGRGRGGTAAALRRVRARTLVAGLDSDHLYPLAQQEHLAAGIAGAGSVRVITSQHGHDAFLIEAEQVGACLGELLAAIPGHAPGGATPTRRGSARLKQCRGRISG